MDANAGQPGRIAYRAPRPIEVSAGLVFLLTREDVGVALDVLHRREDVFRRRRQIDRLLAGFRGRSADHMPFGVDIFPLAMQNLAHSRARQRLKSIRRLRPRLSGAAELVQATKRLSMGRNRIPEDKRP
jgi:hypothetical protein